MNEKNTNTTADPVKLVTDRSANGNQGPVATRNSRNWNFERGHKSC